MPFWKVGRATSGDSIEGSAARAVEPHLEPIQLFTHSGRVAGWIVALDERVTDVLNRRETLRLCVDATADIWAEVERDELLIVAPPPRTGPNPRRIHRHKRRIRILLGPYTVEGVAHLPPGMPLDPFLLRTRQRFIAVTDAIVAREDERDGGEMHPVVILNVHNMQDLEALLTLA